MRMRTPLLSAAATLGALALLGAPAARREAAAAGNAAGRLEPRVAYGHERANLDV